MSRLLACLRRVLMLIHGRSLDWSLPGCKNQAGDLLRAGSFSLTGKSLAISVNVAPV